MTKTNNVGPLLIFDIPDSKLALSVNQLLHPKFEFKIKP